MNNKQLLNDVECDIQIYQGRGLYCPPKPKAEVHNANRGLDKSQYQTKAKFNNSFVIYSKYILSLTLAKRLKAVVV